MLRQIQLHCVLQPRSLNEMLPNQLRQETIIRFNCNLPPLVGIIHVI